MLFVEQILGDKLLAMMCYCSQKDASENFLLTNLVLATRNNNTSELIYLVLASTAQYVQLRLNEHQYIFAAVQFC